MNVCGTCKKEFSKKYGLERHILTVHASNKKEKIDDSDKTCSHCKKIYSSTPALRKHMKQFHQVDVPFHIKMNCPLCEMKYPTRSGVITHLISSHKINIVQEELVFNSEQQFFDWKAHVEKSTTSSFILTCRPKPDVRGKFVRNFYCHRSGTSTVSVAKYRSPKPQGSCKIGSYCPAGITVTTHNKQPERLEVKYISTHVGHENEVRFIRLSDDERLALANKIRAGVDFDRILDEVRQGATGRLKYLTKRDLHNIRRDFKLIDSTKCAAPTRTTSLNKSVKEEPIEIDASFQDGSSDSLQGASEIEKFNRSWTLLQTLVQSDAIQQLPDDALAECNRYMQQILSIMSGYQSCQLVEVCYIDSPNETFLPQDNVVISDCRSVVSSTRNVRKTLIKEGG